jgi:hypothetical protein
MEYYRGADNIKFSRVWTEKCEGLGKESGGSLPLRLRDTKDAFAERQGSFYGVYDKIDHQHDLLPFDFLLPTFTCHYSFLRVSAV